MEYNYQWIFLFRKITLFLVILLCATKYSYAFQDSTIVNIDVTNSTIENVFRNIEKQTGLIFYYAAADLNGKELITIRLLNVKLNTAIDKLLKGKKVSWTQINGGIVIRKSDLEQKKTGSPERIVPLVDTLPKITIKGTVTSEDGFVLPGTTVQIRGTAIGTITNVQGQFTLTGAPPRSSLIISYTGYQLQQYIIKDEETLIVRLKKLIGILDEKVIIAYGTSSRRKLTGAVSRVTSKDIEKQPVSNPMAALIGRMPGVTVTQQTGVPGGAFKIQIRGQNSLRNQIDDGNIPLYIVDGVPYNSTIPAFFNGNSGALGIQGYSPLNLINPNDIESIEVLKDADATAIYGSRGANGVILITTKRGTAGNNQVDVNFQMGMSNVPRKIKLLNTQQYLEMRKEAYRNDGIVSYPATAYDVNGKWDQQRYTDWQEELIGRTAQYIDASVSISGGNNNTQYRFGGSYHKENTVFPGKFSDKRGAFNLNLNNTSANKKFKTIVSVSYAANDNDVPSIDLTGTAMKLAPNAPSLFDSTGNLNWGTNYYFGNNNPLSYTRQTFKTRSNNLIGNVVLSYEIIKNLFLKSSFGYTNTNINSIGITPLSSYDPADAPFLDNISQFSNSKSESWIIEPQISWQSNFKIGRFNVLVGSTFQSLEREGLQQRGTGFANEVLMRDLKSASKITILNTSYSQYRYTGIFGRINYELLGKYIINFTGRRDGSSRFGPANQFANFGAAGLAWIFSSERFIFKTFKFLSFGKFRASYGSTGSDNIADYGYNETYASGGQYLGVTSLNPQNIYNPEYSWEVNRKFEVALELGFLNDRLFAHASYYRNRSSNQLVGYSLPPTAGFPTVQYNLEATVQNTGFEFEISSQNIKGQTLQWTTALNLTIPRDKLVSYPNLAGSSYYTRYSVGYPLSISRLYEFQGVDPVTGIYKVKDVNNDKIINAADAQTLVFRGQHYYGGLQNQITYKGIQLDFLFQFVNQEGFNYRNAGFSLPGTFSNQPSYVLDRWQKNGDITTIQKFTTGSNALVSAGFVQANSSNDKIGDASFVRLKNASISYNLPISLYHKLRIKNAKFYILGQNLFIITKYKGLDPENQSVTSMPPLRVLTAGIQLTL